MSIIRRTLTQINLKLPKVKIPSHIQSTLVPNDAYLLEAYCEKLVSDTAATVWNELASDTIDIVAGSIIKSNEIVNRQHFDNVNLVIMQQSDRVDAVNKLNSDRVDAVNKLNSDRVDAVNKLNSDRVDAVNKLNSDRVDAVNKLNSDRVDTINESHNRNVESLKVANFRLTTRCEQTTHQLLIAQNRFSIRGAIEHIREIQENKIKTNPSHTKFQGKEDHLLSSIYSDEEFQSKFKRTLTKNHHTLKHGIKSLTGLYHTTSKSQHNSINGDILIMKGAFEESERMSLECLFTYFNVKYICTDELGKVVQGFDMGEMMMNS